MGEFGAIDRLKLVVKEPCNRPKYIVGMCGTTVVCDILYLADDQLVYIQYNWRGGFSRSTLVSDVKECFLVGFSPYLDFYWVNGSGIARHYFRKTWPTEESVVSIRLTYPAAPRKVISNDGRPVFVHFDVRDATVVNDATVFLSYDGLLTAASHEIDRGVVSMKSTMDSRFLCYVKSS
jgi:hypothetical protein